MSDSVDVLPTWEGFLIPVLEVMSDGRERSNREVKVAVADHIGLTDSQRIAMLSSGRQTRAENRIGWALSFLTRAQALERPRRARYVMTDTGRGLLRDHPDGLTEQNR